MEREQARGLVAALRRGGFEVASLAEVSGRVPSLRGWVRHWAERVDRVVLIEPRTGWVSLRRWLTLLLLP